VVRDSAGRTIRIKTAVPEIFLAEFRWAAGEPGPKEHIHKEHCDLFYVQEGRVALLVGSEWHELGRGEFALVPPGVVHTFRNHGPGEARFLNLHVPDCGFADNLRGRREQWDTFDPPEDGGRPASLATTELPAEHELVSAREIELEPGQETRVTGHYYVLEGPSAGTAAFRCVDEVLTAGAEPLRVLSIT
jgi:quercetin dioxygenase-like cupin family protein